MEAKDWKAGDVVRWTQDTRHNCYKYTTKNKEYTIEEIRLDRKEIAFVNDSGNTDFGYIVKFEFVRRPSENPEIEDILGPLPVPNFKADDEIVCICKTEGSGLQLNGRYLVRSYFNGMIITKAIPDVSFNASIFQKVEKEKKEAPKIEQKPICACCTEFIFKDGRALIGKPKDEDCIRHDDPCQFDSSERNMPELQKKMFREQMQRRVDELKARVKREDDLSKLAQSENSISKQIRSGSGNAYNLNLYQARLNGTCND